MGGLCRVSVLCFFALCALFVFRALCFLRVFFACFVFCFALCLCFASLRVCFVSRLVFFVSCVLRLFFFFHYWPLSASRSITFLAHVVPDVTLILEQVCAALLFFLAFPAQLYAEDTLRFASPTRRQRYLENDQSYDLTTWHANTPRRYASNKPNPAEIARAV